MDNQDQIKKHQEPKKVGEIIKIEDYFYTRLNYYCIAGAGMEHSLKEVETRRAVQLFVWYINRDKRFEEFEEGYSLDKGIWLFGNWGTGKTIMMKAYIDAKAYQGKRVTMEGCSRIVEKFLRVDGRGNVTGYSSLKKYTHEIDIERVLDDLGEEPSIINHYGTKLRLIRYILLQRYRNRNKTHITTNLSMKEVKEIYGQKVVSRINEMFNIIPLGSKKNSIDYRV